MFQITAKTPRSPPPLAPKPAFQLRILGLLLQRGGFAVRHACSGAECRRLFSAHQASIALLVVDCALPDAHGGSLSHELRTAVPRLPILLTSGRRQGALLALLAADGPTGFLPKPFLPAEVTRQVRALLPSPV